VSSSSFFATATDAAATTAPIGQRMNNSLLFTGVNSGNAAVPSTPQSAARKRERLRIVLRPSASESSTANTAPDTAPKTAPIQAARNGPSPGSALSGKMSPTIANMPARIAAHATAQVTLMPSAPRHFRRNPPSCSVIATLCPSADEDVVTLGYNGERCGTRQAVAAKARVAGPIRQEAFASVLRQSFLACNGQERAGSTQE
jgi:hypothetical protein